MLKKNLSLIFIIIAFIFSLIFFLPHNKILTVRDVESSKKITFDNGKSIEFSDIDCFDSVYSEKNSELARKIGISEEEAFILGNLSKYWTANILEGRRVILKDNDIIFLKNSYRTKFISSGFCILNFKPTNVKAFENKLIDIRRGKYRVLDLDTNKVYRPEEIKSMDINNYLILKTYAIPFKNKVNNISNLTKKYKKVVERDGIKVIFTDLTTNLVPNRKCETEVCKEILNNINNSKKSIDMAIYGYSSVPKIEEALIEAKNRGVNIRLVFDSNSKGENIYPNTYDFLKIATDSISDKNSSEANKLMHNKFYIFDDEILITGSANLSRTDMSGYNTNSIIVLKSPEIAEVYKNEFEQMYSGKFHNEKASKNKFDYSIGKTKIRISFSPQDKGIENLVLPLINKAQDYIYIPTFVLTEKRVTEALIKAKERGVDVKIIMDALNSSMKHSKIKELRQAGIPVKSENYAGKMHSKSIIVDNKYTIIGSMNFSNSGENYNDENFVLVEDSEIATNYKDFFEYQWSKIDNKWLKHNVRAESIDSIGSCADGIDNNYDGLIDSADPDCKVL